MEEKSSIDFLNEFKERLTGEEITEEQYIRLKDEIRVEFEEKEKALNALWVLSGGGNIYGDKAGRSVTKTAREIIEDSSEEFTSVTLREEILKRVPNVNMASISTTISTLLRRMRDSGEIEVVSTGWSPANPHVYKKKTTNKEDE